MGGPSGKAKAPPATALPTSVADAAAPAVAESKAGPSQIPSAISASILHPVVKPTPYWEAAPCPSWGATADYKERHAACIRNREAAIARIAWSVRAHEQAILSIGVQEREVEQALVRLAEARNVVTADEAILSEAERERISCADISVRLTKEADEARRSVALASIAEAKAKDVFEEAGGQEMSEKLRREATACAAVKFKAVAEAALATTANETAFKSAASKKAAATRAKSAHEKAKLANLRAEGLVAPSRPRISKAIDEVEVATAKRDRMEQEARSSARTLVTCQSRARDAEQVAAEAAGSQERATKEASEAAVALKQSTLMASELRYAADVARKLAEAATLAAEGVRSEADKTAKVFHATVSANAGAAFVERAGLTSQKSTMRALAAEAEADKLRAEAAEAEAAARNAADAATAAEEDYERRLELERTCTQRALDRAEVVTKLAEELRVATEASLEAEASAEKARQDLLVANLEVTKAKANMVQCEKDALIAKREEDDARNFEAAAVTAELEAVERHASVEREMRERAADLSIAAAASSKADLEAATLEMLDGEASGREERVLRANENLVKKEAIEAKAHAAEEAANKVEDDASDKVRASKRALGDAETALKHEEERLRQVRQKAEEKAAVEAATKAAAAQATAEAEAADLALRKNLHWAIGNRPTVARACHLYGDGLLFAAMGQESSFTIEACAADGIRQPTGGDKFVVVVRAAGQGRRFNGRVIDHGDGSYTVRFRTTAISGACKVQVSLLGEDLPGSPYTCMVATPLPHASRCFVRGAALHTIVAHETHVFEVGFRDLLGHVTAAIELDVCVQRISPGANEPSTSEHEAGHLEGEASSAAAASSPTSALDPSSTTALSQFRPALAPAALSADGVPLGPPTLSLAQERHAESERHSILVEGGIVKPLGDFDTVLVGASALVITKDSAVDSLPLGQMAPGRELKLLKTMSFDLGMGMVLVRGQVAITDEERSTDFRARRPRSPQERKYPAGFGGMPLGGQIPATPSRAKGDGTARSSSTVSYASTYTTTTTTTTMRPSSSPHPASSHATPSRRSASPPKRHPALPPPSPPLAIPSTYRLSCASPNSSPLPSSMSSAMSSAQTTDRSGRNDAASLFSVRSLALRYEQSPHRANPCANPSAFSYRSQGSHPASSPRSQGSQTPSYRHAERAKLAPTVEEALEELLELPSQELELPSSSASSSAKPRKVTQAKELLELPSQELQLPSSSASSSAKPRKVTQAKELLEVPSQPPSAAVAGGGEGQGREDSFTRRESRDTRESGRLSRPPARAARASRASNDSHAVAFAAAAPTAAPNAAPAAAASPATAAPRLQMGSRETSRELKLVLLDVASAAAPKGVVAGTDADKAPRSPPKKSATRPTSRALGWAPEAGAESAKGASGSKDGAPSDRKGASGGVERGPSNGSNREVLKKEASTSAGRAKSEAAADGKLVDKGGKRSDDDKDGGHEGGSKESGKEGGEEGGKEGGKEGGEGRSRRESRASGEPIMTPEEKREAREVDKKFKSMRARQMEAAIKEQYEKSVRLREEAEAEARAKERAAREAAERAEREAREAVRLKEEHERAERAVYEAKAAEAVRMIISPRSYRRWKANVESDQKRRSSASYVQMQMEMMEMISPISTHRSLGTHRTAASLSPQRTPASVSMEPHLASRGDRGGSKKGQAIERGRTSPPAGHPRFSVADTPASRDTQLASKDVAAAAAAPACALKQSAAGGTAEGTAEGTAKGTAEGTAEGHRASREVLAATRVQAVQRGRSTRLLLQMGGATNSPASQRSCHMPRDPLHMRASSAGRTPSVHTARSARTVHSGSVDTARSGAVSARAVPALPAFGWVTLAMGDVQYAHRRVARLPAAIKQQHIDHWARRGALDSARERQRARSREEDLEAERWRQTPHFGGDAARASRAKPTRPVYLHELDADPRGVGFAYGGLTPGRLHSHGRLVDVHQAAFSVGVAGRYELHVALRHDRESLLLSTPLPGSPFQLTVLPGMPHPLSTELPPTHLPLLGVAEAWDDVALAVSLKVTPQGYEPLKGCTLVLPSRDKMGNLCVRGGANVTCGVVEGTTERLIDADEGDGAIRFAPSVQGRCIDLSDGSYSLRWWAFAPCTCEVWVKMDGLHVLGSPAPLRLVPFVQLGAIRAGHAALSGRFASLPLSDFILGKPTDRPLSLSPRLGSAGRHRRMSSDSLGSGREERDTAREAVCTAAAIKLQAIQRGRSTRRRIPPGVTIPPRADRSPGAAHVTAQPAQSPASAASGASPGPDATRKPTGTKKEPSTSATSKRTTTSVKAAQRQQGK